MNLLMMHRNVEKDDMDLGPILPTEKMDPLTPQIGGSTLYVGAQMEGWMGGRLLLITVRMERVQEYNVLETWRIEVVLPMD